MTCCQHCGTPDVRTDQHGECGGWAFYLDAAHTERSKAEYKTLLEACATELRQATEPGGQIIPVRNGDTE